MRQLKEAQYAEAMSNSMLRNSAVTCRFVSVSFLESISLESCVGSKACSHSGTRSGRLFVEGS